MFFLYLLCISLCYHQQFTFCLNYNKCGNVNGNDVREERAVERNVKVEFWFIFLIAGFNDFTTYWRNLSLNN
jgi:hypothetical protein